MSLSWQLVKCFCNSLMNDFLDFNSSGTIWTCYNTVVKRYKTNFVPLKSRKLFMTLLQKYLSDLFKTSLWQVQNVTLLEVKVNIHDTFMTTSVMLKHIVMTKTLTGFAILVNVITKTLLASLISSFETKTSKAISALHWKWQLTKWHLMTTDMNIHIKDVSWNGKDSVMTVWSTPLEMKCYHVTR